MNLETAVAFVTGTNRGLGAALVAALQQQGVKKIYAGSRSGQSGLNGVVDVKLDVTKADEVAAAVELARDTTLLINNAGLNHNAPLLNPLDESSAQLEMEVNYFGTLRMCRVFAPIIVNNGGGTIVNIASILGRVSVPLVGSVAASKAAQINLSQSLRGQLAENKVTVINVMPGPMDTDMARYYPFAKTAPAQVASTIVEAIKGDIEDVYPDAIAQFVAAELDKDAKHVEKNVTSMMVSMKLPPEPVTV